MSQPLAGVWSAHRGPIHSGGVAAAAAAPHPIYRAKAAAVWHFIRRQPPSFWLINLYLFLEYVRPQDIYEAVYGLPIPFWTIMACGAAYVLEGARPRAWTIADSFLVLFTAIVLFSGAAAYSPSQSFEEFPLYFSWLLVYLLITAIVSNERRLFVFMLLYLVYNVKMTQHGIRGWAESGFGFRSWGVSCAPSWFQNSGECGIQMSMIFPVALFLLLAVKPLWAKWKFWGLGLMLVGGSLITMVASSSRGALLALGGIALWMILTNRRRRIKSLLAVAVMTVLVLVLLPAEQMDRFREMGTDGTSVTRKTYWADGIEIMRDYPALGIGYRNWLPYYRRHYNPVGEVPHNIFIEAGAELGIVGLVGFVLLILATFVLNRRTRRIASRLEGVEAKYLWALGYGLDGALIGFLIGGMFVTVLYYPFFWVNLAMTVAAYNATRGYARRLKQESASRVAPPPTDWSVSRGGVAPAARAGS